MIATFSMILLNLFTEVFYNFVYCKTVLQLKNTHEMKLVLVLYCLDVFLIFIWIRIT